MTTREAANDEIWQITDKLRKKVEEDFKNNITIETIDIWPEDGIQFVGYYQCDGDPWMETVSWDKWKLFDEKNLGE
jgi:hypothetical protein